MKLNGLLSMTLLAALAGGMTWSSAVAQTSSIPATTQPQPPYDIESDLESRLRSGGLEIKRETGLTTLAAGIELTGMQCSPFPEFTKREGVDDAIRLQALKEFRIAMPAKILRNDSVLSIVKKIPVDQLLRTLDLSKQVPSVRAVIELLRENKLTYIESARKAQNRVWSQISKELQTEIAQEVKEQSGITISLSDPKLDARERRGLKEVVLCMADLELSGDERLVALVPVKDGKLVTSRPLVDVSFFNKNIDQQ